MPVNRRVKKFSFLVASVILLKKKKLSVINIFLKKSFSLLARLVCARALVCVRAHTCVNHKTGSSFQSFFILPKI